MKIGTENLHVELELYPRGKAFICGIGGICFGAGAIIFGSPILGIVAATLGVACFVALWISRAPAGGCGGRVKWQHTTDGEIAVGLCDGCDRWTVIVRGEIAGAGRGFDGFKDFCDDYVDQHSSYLPHVTARLRKIVEQTESNSLPEDGFEVERQT